MRAHCVQALQKEQKKIAPVTSVLASPKWIRIAVLDDSKNHLLKMKTTPKCD